MLNWRNFYVYIFRHRTKWTFTAHLDTDEIIMPLEHKDMQEFGQFLLSTLETKRVDYFIMKQYLFPAWLHPNKERLYCNWGNSLSSLSFALQFNEKEVHSFELHDKSAEI